LGEQTKLLVCTQFKYLFFNSQTVTIMHHFDTNIKCYQDISQGALCS